MTDREKKVARQVQGDIPLGKRPFETIARRIGMDEEEVIETLKRLQEKGAIRRFGAVLRHTRAGFSGNALVVWAVPEEQCEEIGSILASYREISHCYERTPPFEGVYNLFTMVHLTGDGGGQPGEADRMDAFVRRISEAIGIGSYRILRTLEEFKKSSMEYF
ncbi:MAG: Lrp/AsnC family transcriptional regulator [Deltaproteobacteria bacterium]|nr:Lrp/AsnC family transcriptional regulator [Deltaproteobacteria bacterium]